MCYVQRFCVLNMLENLLVKVVVLLFCSCFCIFFNYRSEVRVSW